MLMQLTAAHGPAECERAVQLSLQKLQQACEKDGIDLEILESLPSRHGYKSVLLRSAHPQARNWFAPWLGSHQWIFTSPFRPRHKRKNWFIALQECPQPEQLPKEGEILFSSCRASGKGGQHVNTTDSAVHATHTASGVSVKVMSQRSQHANKRLAIELIALKLATLQEQQHNQSRQQRTLQHWQVERGRPVKIFKRDI